jgi:serine/threonine protein kinase/formylglycine-generating enzyme required for sulfatase activity
MWGVLLSKTTASGSGHGETLDSAPSSDSVSVPTHESGDESPAAFAAPDFELLARGSTLGRYTVLEKLGAGAMGVVYSAYDPELDRKIALKLLRPQQSEGDQARRQARMVREAQAIAKVSHTNVVGIFEIGVHEGHVFMAMEHLSGGTLRDWVTNKKPTWREIVKMYIQVGHGLAAAHAEGLIHRDFKPDNVLLDKNGVPKVVDFGLVRLAAAARDRFTSSGGVPAQTAPDKLELSAEVRDLSGSPAALTRTGALTGTPAYMAPEQYYGRPVEARTDQFAFCVSLYESLYGERPFGGTNIIQLADSVTSGRINEAPKNGEVPAWVRRALLRGLALVPASRWPGMDALVAVLADDPYLRRRRRLTTALLTLSIIGLAIGARYWAGRQQLEVDRQVSDNLRSANTILATLPSLSSKFEEHRRNTLQLFDSGDPRAESEWQQALSGWAQVDKLATSAFSALETALKLRPSPEIGEKLARAMLEQARRCEYANHFETAGALLARLPKPAPTSPALAATVSISTSSYPATVTILRYDALPQGALVLTPVNTLSLNGPAVQSLPRGSYLLRFSGPDKLEFDYPLFLRMGENATLSIALPPATGIPAGFSYVPAGRFLVGDADEKLRTGFTNTVPLHDRSTPGFLVAKHEITYGEWIAFLNTLPSDRMRALYPHSTGSVGQALVGSVALRRNAERRWHVVLTPVSVPYHAFEGEKIVYAGRKARERQDWLRMPVAGISAVDVREYAAWLSRTLPLPGARLCSDLEWERAARGADDRRFPHGNHLLPDDANHDVTYERVPSAFGPDEVGSHISSRSPFGVDDMAGNVWELVVSPRSRDSIFIRGGSYYHFENSELVTNREPFDAQARSAHVGARLCADLPQDIPSSRLDFLSQQTGHDQ